MKRILFFGVCLLLLCLCVLTGSADTPADATRTFTWNGTALTSEDQTAAFWEYPQLTAGQTRTNGTLTFVNQGFGSVTVDLSDVQLPYDDDAALAYLGALRLTVRDGDRVLYDGAFSKINDTGLTEPVTVGGGETCRLTVALSCDFAFEGEASCGEQVLYWNWAPSASFMQSVLSLWMYWAPALLLIVVLIVALRLRRRGSLPEKEPEQPTEPAADPALPPDLPRPAPRKPVTIQIDPAKAAKPRRHKAAHAAPRHAKKK